MSRRETFLESARAVNDQALNAIPAPARSSMTSGDLAAILGAALSSAFTIANQLPNLVAALVLLVFGAFAPRATTMMTLGSIAALAIAARIPGARYGSIEVRPIWVYS